MTNFLVINDGVDFGTLTGRLASVVQGEVGKVLVIDIQDQAGNDFPITGATGISAATTTPAGVTTPVSGTISVASGGLSWELSSGDVGTAGEFTLITQFTFNGDIYKTHPVRWIVIEDPEATAVQNPSITGVSELEAIWLTAEKAAVEAADDGEILQSDGNNSEGSGYLAGTSLRKHNFTAVTAPTVNDDTADGYAAGSYWVDTVGEVVYFCADATLGAAVWVDASAGGAAALDAEYLAVEAGYSDTPSAVWRTAASNLFIGIRAALGIVTLGDGFDFLYLLAHEVAADALINVANPGTHDATNINAMAFELRRGYTGDGATSYLDSNYTPSTAAINYALNNACIGLYSRTNIAADVNDMGAESNIDNRASFSIRGSSNSFSGALNGHNHSVADNMDSLGLFTLDRANSTDFQFYRNGILFGSRSRTSTALPEIDLFIGVMNSDDAMGTPSTRQYSLAFASRSMDATEQAAFYTAVQNFLADIGAAVHTHSYQPLDAGLTDLAGLAVTDGNIPVGNGTNWVAESGATARTSLGLTIGTNVQAYSAKLAALAALTWAANSIILLTGTGTAAVQALAAHVLAFVQSASAADARAAIGAAALGANTFTGEQTLADNLLTRPVLKDYGETINAIGSIGGGSQDIDLTLGNVVSGTVDTSTTTFTFSNPSASGTACSFTLFLTNGGSQTVNWPASVDWAGGAAPTLTAAGVDVLTFATLDGGSVWFGFAAGLDMS